MSTRIRRTACAMGVIAALGAAGTVTAVGCGGDDTQVNPGDAGNDSTAADASHDGSTPDSPLLGDAGMDSMQMGDTAPPFDAFGIDVQSLIDAPPLAAYLPTVAATICPVLRQCCGITMAKWNEAQCETDFGPPNGDGGGSPGFAEINRYASAFGGGRVFYDKALADKCIADFQSILTQPDGGNLCGAFPASFYAQINQDCVSAVKGTSPLDGGTCQVQGECAAGGYCNVPTDGGLGSCAAVGGTGAACNPALGFSEDCNYMGLGVPADYCNVDSGTCAGQLGLNASCGSDVQCLSDFCSGNSSTSCLPTGLFSDPMVPNGTCVSYTLP